MKPTVFNYQEYERVVEENKKLNAEVADLRIRCRIADGDKRDCKSCKHQKPDGCSRWDCEYEPVMDDLIRRQDAIEAVQKVWCNNDDQKDFKQRYYEMGNNDAVEDAIGYIDALPSADRPTGECRTCGRNADNGGVHEDGRTKCPIQEHYALLLDGYCHLYEPYNCGAKMGGEDGEKE